MTTTSEPAEKKTKISQTNLDDSDEKPPRAIVDESGKDEEVQSWKSSAMEKVARGIGVTVVELEAALRSHRMDLAPKLKADTQDLPENEAAIADVGLWLQVVPWKSYQLRGKSVYRTGDIGRIERIFEHKSVSIVSVVWNRSGCTTHHPKQTLFNDFAAFRKGAEVRVRWQMWSDTPHAVLLHNGVLGVIADLNEDGDALIKFREIEAVQLVRATNFDKLELGPHFLGNGVELRAREDIQTKDDQQKLHIVRKGACGVVMRVGEDADRDLLMTFEGIGSNLCIPRRLTYKLEVVEADEATPPPCTCAPSLTHEPALSCTACKTCCEP